MTFRERLADWISGGALSQLKLQLAEKDNRFQDSLRGWDDAITSSEASVDWLHGYLEKIYEETANGKSGTAQKIHRMAKEALGE